MHCLQYPPLKQKTLVGQIIPDDKNYLLLYNNVFISIGYVIRLHSACNIHNIKHKTNFSSNASIH